MKWLDRKLKDFALKIAQNVNIAIDDQMQLVRNCVIKLATEVRALPAYLTLMSGDGKTAVSEIVYLLPGDRKSVSIDVRTRFTKWSTIKSNAPFWLDKVTVGNESIMQSQSEACLICSLNKDIESGTIIKAIIWFPR